MQHEKIEKNITLMSVLIVAVISIGGFIEILPLVTSSDATEPYPGVTPYPALQLAGQGHLHPRRLLRLPFAANQAVS